MYVELPEVGSTVTKGETYGVVESVKVRTALAAAVGGARSGAQRAARLEARASQQTAS